MGAWTIVALVFIIISMVFAAVFNQGTNAELWSLWAIFVVLFCGAKSPW
jgi:hypothetical protein